MIRKLIKKWFGLYDINDLVAGAHCGYCGSYLPQQIIPRTNTSWGICPHDCSGDDDSFESIKTKLTSLLQELHLLISNIERNTFSFSTSDVWSRLISIRKRYKIPQ
jgi:hypothetical protein